MKRKISVVAAALALTAPWAVAAPTVEYALSLKPVQPDVEADAAPDTEAKNCKLVPAGAGEASGWLVLDSHGKVLRRFSDTNHDQAVDQWSYYLNGIEVYRDIDANFNGKADQYRWLATGGTRWGIDRDEDGVVDEWRRISAEEVTAEVVLAVRDQDAGRFRRVLLSAEEIKQLQVDAEREKDLTAKVAAASTGFTKAVGELGLKADVRWLQFGGTRPGVIPAGTQGSKVDLLLYDNVAAIIETEGKHAQLAIGALLKVGEGWRVVDLPRKEAGEGFFYTALAGPNEVMEGDASAGASDKLQSLLAEMEKLDAELAKAQPREELAKLHQRRSSVLRELALVAATDTDRATWWRQFADMTSAAIQTGDFPDGVAELKAAERQLESDKQAELAAYVEYRRIAAEYGRGLQDPQADFVKVQENWLKQLEAFVNRHGKSSDAPDAMIQLGLAQELAGKDKEAKDWYGRVAKEFPGSDWGKKAVGALFRVDSTGKPLPLFGRTLDGKQFDVKSLRGRVVLVHYWATWSEPCKQDLKTIQQAVVKYGRKGFIPVGINLDSDQQALAAFLRGAPLAWPQLAEPQGLEGEMATRFGVLTLPTMLLLDQNGNVIRRSIYGSELEAELARLLK